MPIGRNIPAFEADFQCTGEGCNSIIGVKVALTIVQSQTGAEVTCKHCGQRYKVTQRGAFPFDGMEPLRTIDSQMGRMDIRAEAPALRLPQSGSEGEQRSEPPYAWALRMPRVRRDKA